MAESAALLVDEVLPDQPVRQWVLTFPYPLRLLFASQPEATGATVLPSVPHEYSIAEGPELAGPGNTALPSRSFLTPAWPSVSDSQGDCDRNRI